MIWKYHNHTLQTNPLYREEEPQNINKSIKAKQPALSSSSKWLQN